MDKEDLIKLIESLSKINKIEHVEIGYRDIDDNGYQLEWDED